MDERTSPADDAQIDTILGDWRARREAGDTVSPDDVIAEHPELADSLRARFDAMAAYAASKQPALREVAMERYADFRVLGQGGMGIVYWAIDADLHRQVAFKVVRPDAGQSGAPTPQAPLGLTPPDENTPSSHAFATLKARFLQEAWVTAGLEHPGVVPIYEVGRTPEGIPYYTMRYVRGSRTLAAAVAESTGKGIDDRLALLETFLKVCDTIRYAHAHGVIHRDLKPDNIALGEFGEVVVLDWGLAKMTGKPDAFVETWQHRLQEYRDASDLRTLASALGTPGYMAPEAALGRTAEVDAKSDVYSLGAILYQILTGRLPYEFRSYGELAMKLMKEDPPGADSVDAAVPAELARICASALSRDRERRTASVDALAAEVRSWIAQREADRETQTLMQQARVTFDASKSLTGDLRIHQLDIAAAAASQVLVRRPGDAAAVELQREIDELRETGVEERAHAARRKVLRRAAIAALAFLVVGGAVVAKVLYDQKQEAVEAKEATGQALSRALAAEAKTAKESNAKDAALARATEAESKTAKERDAKDAALVRAEGRRLFAQSQLVLAQDPALALRLALEGIARDPGLAGTSAVVAALLQHRERLMIRAAGGSVRSATCAADGNRLLTCEQDRRVRIRDIATGAEVFAWPRTGDAGRASDAVFLADGDRIAVTDADTGFAGVVDVATGRVVHELKGVPARSIFRQWSSDGRRALIEVSAGPEQELDVWDAENGRLGVIGKLVVNARLSPDGSHVLEDAHAAGTRLRDVVSGAVVAALPPGDDKLLGMVFLDAAPVVIVAGVETFRDREDDERAGLTVRLVDVRSGELVRRFVSARLFDRRGEPPLETAEVYGQLMLVSGDDGTYVADLAGAGSALDRIDSANLRRGSASANGRLFGTKVDDRIVVWDIPARTRLCELPGAGGYTTLAGLTPLSGRAVTYANDGALRVWDVGAQRPAMRPAAAGAGFALFALGGSRLVVEGKYGGPSLWDAESGLAVSARGGTGPSVCADGSRVAWMAEGRVCVLDASEGREIASFDDEHGRSTALDRSGRRVLSWSPKEPVRVYDVESKSVLAEIRSESTCTGAAFVLDGSCVVVTHASTSGASVRCIEIPSCRDRWRFDRNGVVYRPVARGELLLLHSGPYQGALLSASDGKERSGVRISGRISDLSDDGGVAATCDDDGLVRIVETTGGRTLHELRVLEGRSGTVDSIRVSADGRRVATLLSRTTLVVWDAVQGRPLLEFGRDTNGRGWIGNDDHCLDLTLDARRIAAAFLEETAVVLPVDALAAARAASPRDLTATERLRYLPPPGVGLVEVRAAEALVRRLEITVALASDLRAAVDAAPTISEPVREAARLLVEGRVDDGRSLNAAAWICVADPQRTPAEYAVALERAVSALRFTPNDFDVLNTVGVAQYRCAKYTEALETLRRCDDKHSAASGGGVPSDVAFLAMAHHRLGHAEQAKADLTRLRGVMTKFVNALNPESKGFQDEAEALIGGLEQK